MQSDRKRFNHTMLISGVMSNYLDRLFYGCVIDMFKISIFQYDLFVCNLADIFITCGTLGLFFKTSTNQDTKFDKYKIKSEKGL